MEKTASIRTLVIACLASIGLGTSANADTLLIFGQASNTDEVTATRSGSTTTLISGPSAASPTTIPVTIVNLADVTLPPGTPVAFETFTLASNAPVAGGQEGDFSGTIAITGGPDGTGQNLLTLTVTNGLLTFNGTGAGLIANNAPATSDNPGIQSLLGGPAGLASASLSFVNVTPPEPGGSTLTSFTAQNSGLFSTVVPGVVPEPASVVMASMAVFAGLGCYGWRRLKATKVRSRPI
jgi:hypothetical protein